MAGVASRIEDHLQIKAPGLEWDKRHAYIEVQQGLFFYKKVGAAPDETPGNPNNSDFT